MSTKILGRCLRLLEEVIVADAALAKKVSLHGGDTVLSLKVTTFLHSLELEAQEAAVKWRESVHQ